MLITEQVYDVVEKASRRFSFGNEPDDVAQDAYLSMLQWQDEPQHPAAVAARAVKVAAWKRHRNERAAKRDARRTQALGLTEVACRGSVPLAEVLEGMEESQVQLLVDRYLEGYTVAEMAAARGLSAGHVCRLLREALQEARKRCE